jgi:SAM-dependent methyltransferase
MDSLDPTGRFSSRAEDYVRWRPGYPPEVIELLRERCGLGAGSVVADLGSGTGIFTRRLLETGAVVNAVEPNAEMRRQAETALAQFQNCRSVAAPAEDTGLAEHSIDLIAAAQAAHWFDVEKARAEFRRIAKPGGWLALVWNTRRTAGTPFLREYEALLRRYAGNYAEISANQDSADRVAALFAPSPFSSHTFDNQQHFDWEGLAGRVRSSSYVPPPGHPNHEPLFKELRALYESYHQEGRVAFQYDTRFYLGRL